MVDEGPAGSDGVAVLARSGLVVDNGSIGHDAAVHPGNDLVVARVHLVPLERFDTLEVRHQHDRPMRRHQSEVGVDLDTEDAGHRVDEALEPSRDLVGVAAASGLVLGGELERDYVADHSSSLRNRHLAAY